MTSGVPYLLNNSPLDTPMVINVDLFASRSPGGASAGQIHGPTLITLHPGHLSEAGVDFRITAIAGPR